MAVATRGKKQLTKAERDALREQVSEKAKAKAERDEKAELRKAKSDAGTAKVEVLADGTVVVTRTGILKLDLVGTAEAALDILHVERPRIGRWRKSGIMPEPVGEIAAGPVWLRPQITGMVKEREKHRRGGQPLGRKAAKK